MEVISIVPHIAKRKLIEILQISDSDGETMIFLLENKKTLSTALRAVGFRSTNEISRETWASLRTWRDVYYPENHMHNVQMNFEIKLPNFLKWFLK